MPLIPSYQASLQQRTDSPVKVSDSDIARASGSAIAQLGRGVFEVGETLLAQQRIREKTKYQIDEKNFSYDAADAANTIEKNALLSSKPDGSDMVSIFETEYDKYIQERLKKESGSPEYLALLNNSAKEVRTATRAKLLDTSSKKYIEFADKGFADIKNRAGSRIRKNPLMYEKELSDYTEMLNNSALAPAMKYQGIESAKKEFATEAVNSYIEAERWDEAKESIDSQFAGVYTGEEKEKLVDEIEGTRWKVNNRKLQELDKNIKTNKEQLEIINTKFVRNRTEEIVAIRRMDPTKEPKMVAIKDMEAVLDADEASGDITHSQAESLRKMLLSEKKQEIGFQEFSYWDRLAIGKDLDQLAQDVRNNLRDMDPEHASRLMLAIDKEKERQSRKKKGPSDKRVQVALGKLKAGVGYDVTRGFQKAEDGIILGNATIEFWELYNKNPKYQSNPNDLADLLLDKYFWDNAKDPAIMQIIQFDPEAKAMSRAQDLYKKGKFQSKEEYLSVLKALKARLQKEKDLKKRKDGTK